MRFCAACRSVLGRTGTPFPFSAGAGAAANLHTSCTHVGTCELRRSLEQACSTKPQNQVECALARPVMPFPPCFRGAHVLSWCAPHTLTHWWRTCPQIFLPCFLFFCEDPLASTGRYEKLQTLGRGAFGFVHLGRNLQSNELAAIKFLKRSDVNKYVESEIFNHSQLRHPHVIQFKEVFLTQEWICIAMVSGPWPAVPAPSREAF